MEICKVVNLLNLKFLGLQRNFKIKFFYEVKCRFFYISCKCVGMLRNCSDYKDLQRLIVVKIVDS